jgi:hypothetical protein
MPPEHPVTTRIATALGSVGYLSILDAMQNVFVLWLLSIVVTPGLSVFCAFAALSIALDQFFHFTFFVAFLCIILRRADLQESLDRVEPVSHQVSGARSVLLAEDVAKGGAPRWSTWIPDGFLPLKTRLAGTTIIICFIMVLNLRFTEEAILRQVARRTFDIVFPVEEKELLDRHVASFETQLNKTREPASWLGLQDQEMAKDILRIVNPGVHRSILRVYEPLVLVRKGANRHTIDRNNEPVGLWPSVGILASHILPLAQTVALVVSTVGILLHYLNIGLPDDKESFVPESQVPFLSVRSPIGYHGLDILMLAASPRGVIVSVGLDHRIRIWDVNQDPESSLSQEIPPAYSGKALWPISAVAIDDRGKKLAILLVSNALHIWDIELYSFASCFPLVQANKRSVCSFFFPRQSKRDADRATTSVVLVRSDGGLTEVATKNNLVNYHRICQGPVLISEPVLSSQLPLRLVTVVADGHAYIAAKQGDLWVSEMVEFSSRPSKPITTVAGFYPLPSLGMMGLALGADLAVVYMVDLQSRSSLPSSLSTNTRLTFCFYFRRNHSKIQHRLDKERNPPRHTCSPTNLSILRHFGC